MEKEQQKNISELQRENELLEREKNELLEREKNELKEGNLRLQETCKTLIDEFGKAISGYNKLLHIINSEVPETIRLAELAAALTVHEFYQEQIELLQQNESDSSELSKQALSLSKSLIIINEKFRNAPQAKKKIAEDFWEPYKKQFNDLIAENKQQSWALNKIKEELIKNGAWSERTKRRSSVPHIGTIRRQLVTDRD